MTIQSFSYKTTRHVSSNEIAPDISVYKDEIYRDDALVSSQEGLTSTSFLTTLKEAQNISGYAKKVSGPGACHLQLYKKGIPEYMRTHLFYAEATEKYVRNSLIQHPFTYILEHGLDDAELLYVSHSDHHVYNTDGHMLPQALHFDYTNGFVDNYEYDLAQFTETLSKRSDIIWGSGEPKIDKIPYYNVEDDRYEFLSFTWTPSDEDWELVKSQMNDSLRHRFVIKNVFGIERGTGLGRLWDLD